MSDYRNRGVSLSDNDFALQGGVNVSGRKGLSGGLWASSIDSTGGSELELDVFAAKSFQVKDASISVGGIGYLYPGGSNLAYGEATVVVSKPVGPFDLSVGANYAPQQQNLGSRDNIYVYTNAAAPLGSVFKAPVTAAATFGYENGSLAFGPDKLDWSLRLTVTTFGFDVSVRYVDNNLDGPRSRPQAVFGINRNF